MLRREGEILTRPLQLAVSVDHRLAGSPCTARVRRGSWERSFNLGELKADGDVFTVFLPESAEETTTSVTVSYNRTEWSGVCRIAPVRRWNVHLVLHSHTDLGFTAPVSEVARIHNENTDRAIDFCRETALWNEDDRFRWTCEVSWQVQNYIRERSPAQVEELMRCVREGSMAVGALYSGEHTDLLGHEEAVRSLYLAAHLRRTYGIRCDTALLCDVPGCTAGFVQVMAKAGITNFICADNNFVAPFLPRTDLPRPFVWEGQDNTEILCWYTDHPFYAYVEGEYYGFVDSVARVEHILPAKLLALENSGYPYDEFQIQYAFDNAPITFRPAEIVREWNARWAFPHLRLSTAGEFLDGIRTKHGPSLPRRKGDWTNWWGGIVTGFPFEESLVRRCHDRAPRVESLATRLWLRNPSAGYPGETLRRIYDGLLAFDEHSGGGAVWQPVSARQQEQAVREGYGFLNDAAVALDELERSTLSALRAMTARGGHDRSVAGEGPAGLPAEGAAAPDHPSVRPESIPAHGDRTSPPRHAPVMLENARCRATVDAASGRLVSLFSAACGRELVRRGEAVNELLAYVSHPVRKIELGKFIPEIYDGTENPGEFMEWPAESRVRVQTWNDPEPCCRVTNSIGDVPWLIQEYRLGTGPADVSCSTRIPRTVLTNPLLRRGLARFLTPDAHLYFRFPFDVQEGRFEYESPCMVLRPSEEQFRGSCHDFFAVQRWCRIVGKTSAVALSMPDTPLVDVGSVGLLRFKKRMDPDQSLLFVRAVSLREWGSDVESPFSKEKDLLFRFDLMGESQPAGAGFGPNGGPVLHGDPPVHGGLGSPAGRLQALGLGIASTSGLSTAGVPGSPESATSAYSFCRLSEPNIEVMTFKRSEDESGVVLRLREVLGLKTEATMSLPGFTIVRARKSMITEEPLRVISSAPHEVSLTFHPFGIETLLLDLRYDGEGKADAP